MLLPLEVATVFQEVTAEPGCRNDPRLSRIPRSHARLVRQTMKIGHTAPTLRPTCVLGVFFVKNKGDSLRLIADCRKANVWFAPPPCVELLSALMWTPLASPMASLRACKTVAMTSQTAFTRCSSLETFARTSAGPVCRTSISRSQRSKVPKSLCIILSGQCAVRCRWGFQRASILHRAQIWHD